MSCLLAGVGGLLPTLSKLAASFAAQPDQPLPGWHFLIALGIFFILGGVLNVPFNRENDLAKALTLGIAAPALITNILAGAANAPNQPTLGPHGAATERSFMIESAFAQSTTPSDASGGVPSPGPPVPAGPPVPGVEVSVQWQIVGYPRLDSNVVSVDADGRSVGRVFIGVPSTLIVPGGTHTITFSIISNQHPIQSGSITLPNNTAHVQILAEVGTRIPGENDFLWGLGRPRESVPSSISLRLM